MTWQPEIDELNRRRKLALEMGGAEKVARQKARGKLTARERIELLFDQDTFREIGTISGKPEYNPDGSVKSVMPANYIFGKGKVAGRHVVVGADDFTIRGGASDAAIPRKRLLSEQMANELRIPIVRLIDSAGGSLKTIETLGFSYVPDNPGWHWVAKNMWTVPVVSLGMGAIAGISAARLVTSHYSLMVRDTSHMFMAGPPIVAKLGFNVTKDELGGCEVHARAGAIDDIAESEEEAVAKAKQFLSYLPSSVYELAERVETNDDPKRTDDWLVEAIPRSRRQVYDIRRIVKSLVDRDTFFELGRMYAGSVVTGLARLNGWPVAIMASDPKIYGGGWTAQTPQKVARFIDLANTFHLPVVNLVDIPGFTIGPDAEKAGTIRQGARAMSALHQADVPWCTIILRKAFGVAGAAHANHERFPYRYAWPSGNWGSIPAEGGLEAAYAAELAAADDPVALRAEIEQRLENLQSPFRTAAAFGIEEIIDPRETRAVLCEFADISSKLRKAGLATVPMRP